MEFPERLKELRNSTGLTQAQLAAIIGITDRGYRKYEAGDSDPTRKILVALADYFNVSLDYLVGREWPKEE